MHLESNKFQDNQSLMSATLSQLSVNGVLLKVYFGVEQGSQLKVHNYNNEIFHIQTYLMTILR